MGLLQPHAGHCGGHGAARLRPAAPRPSVVVHSLEEARAALAAAAELGIAVALWSAVGAAAYLGPLYWQKLTLRAGEAAPGADFIAVLDCAERPGDVLAALRQGLRELCFTGEAELAAKLGQIAEAEGARLYGERPKQALDLRDVTNPSEACRLWFIENSPPLG